MAEDKSRGDSSIEKKLEERIQQLKKQQEDTEERIRQLQEDAPEENPPTGEEQTKTMAVAWTDVPLESQGQEQQSPAEGPQSLAELLGPSFPFQLSVSVGNETLDELAFDQDLVRIGRDTTCEVPIDNLGASRVHAQIERLGRFIVLRDLGSKTGTFIRGKKVEEYCLNSGDEIFLAKHTITFTRLTSTRWHNKDESGKAVRKESREQLMQTMAVDFRNMAQKQAPAPAHLHFVELNRRFPMSKNVIFFGKSPQCDYAVNGFMISEKHAILVNEKKGFVLHHLGFWKPPKVNDKPINMATLKDGDKVLIGDLRFIFRAGEEA